MTISVIMTLMTLAIRHKGCDVAWALFWVLKKALKRVKPLKKGLLRVNLLFWALRKVLKRVDLLKIVLNWEVLLKRGLNWVGYSKKGSREERSYSKEGSGLNWVSHSKKCQREILPKNKKPFCDKKIEVSISGHGWQFLRGMRMYDAFLAFNHFINKIVQNLTIMMPWCFWQPCWPFHL